MCVRLLVAALVNICSVSVMEVPECNVCHVALDEEDHQPRHLGCSHDACTTCIKALIKNGLLECPMCRTVVKAYTPDDLQINHGVVQVLRLFKGLNISQNAVNNGGKHSNTKEMCRIHEHTSDSRCVTCKVWICIKCKECHTQDIGCEIQEYGEFLRNSKKEHKEQVELTLMYIRKELTNLESEKKRMEGIFVKLQNSIEDGRKTLDKCVAATKNVEEACTSMELNECLNISNEWHQHAQIWRRKNTDKSLNLFEDLKSNKKVYTSMEINGKSRNSKMVIANENMYLYCFKEKNISNVISSAKVLAYEQVQRWLPLVRNLVFLDLAISGVVIGQVIICLRQDLPNYASNIPLMFTGEEGHSLLDNLEGWNGWASNLAFDVSSVTNKIDRFTRNTTAGYNVVSGSVLARWDGSDFAKICIYLGQDQPYDDNYEVFGQVSTGLDIVKICRNHSKQSEVTVVDCGLVFKENLLSSNPSYLKY